MGNSAGASWNFPPNVGGSVIGWASDGESLQNYQSETWVSGLSESDTGSGNHAVLTAEIARLAAVGGGIVRVPPGTYNISETIDIPYSNILFVGSGEDIAHNTGGQGTLAATIIQWAGAANGTMFHVRSPEGVSNQKLFGCGFSRIMFHSGYTTANTGADIAVRISSQNKGLISRCFFLEFQSIAIKMDMVTTLFDPRDVQYWNVEFSQSRNAVNDNGGFIIMQGDDEEPSGGTGGTGTGANVSKNELRWCIATITDGDGFRFYNTDHNYINFCSTSSLGTGRGFVLHGNNNEDTKVARKNVFYGISGGNDITALGTETYTHPSHSNIFLVLDESNNTNDPILGTGATALVGFRTDMTTGFTLPNGQLYNGNDPLNAFANSVFDRGDTQFDYAPTSGWSVVEDSANALVGNWVAKNTDTSGTAEVIDTDTYSACIPGDEVYAVAWVKSSGFVGTAFRCQILWYDKDKVFLSSSNGTLYSTEQASYVASELTGTAPASSAYFRVRVTTTKTAGTVYVGSMFGVRKRPAKHLLTGMGTSVTGSRGSNAALASLLTALAAQGIITDSSSA